MIDKSLIFIGLGKMGKNILTHLLESEIKIKIYNRTESVATDFIKSIELLNDSKLNLQNIQPFPNLNQLLQDTKSPRTILLMVTSGQPVDELISELKKAGLTAGDTVIDAGNSWYKDSIRRSTALLKEGINYIDCGTSGGLEGALYGACLMIGGQEENVKSLSWLWQAMSKLSQRAPKDTASGSWEYLGKAGSGHFAKLVHNGIEYGINQAIAEGFDLLAKSDYDYDLKQVAGIYSKGSVIRGWLIELLHRAFSKDEKLNSYKGTIGGGETGSFVLKIAAELNSPQPILEQSIKSRNESKTSPSFASKVVAALRFEYGGHTEPKE